MEGDQQRDNNGAGIQDDSFVGADSRSTRVEGRSKAPSSWGGGTPILRIRISASPP